MNTTDNTPRLSLSSLRGRYVGEVRRQQWELVPLDTIVVDVDATGTRVKIAFEHGDRWFDRADIQLVPREEEPVCDCVLPWQSCPACRAAARLLYHSKGDN